MNNESSLLINSPFALRQQNLKPVFTQIETTERPYTDSEINDLMSKQLERDKKAGLKDNKIKHHCFIYVTDRRNKFRGIPAPMLGVLASLSVYMLYVF